MNETKLIDDTEFKLVYHGNDFGSRYSVFNKGIHIGYIGKPVDDWYGKYELRISDQLGVVMTHSGFKTKAGALLWIKDIVKQDLRKKLEYERF